MLSATVNFNPRSQRRERQGYLKGYELTESTSIHAPSEGSDDPGDVVIDPVADFNPRSQRRERHYYIYINI